jgi:hypothetical protein
MKHITKFVEYIKESKGIINDEYLIELLLPFLDMGIEYRIGDEETITKGEFTGRKYKQIFFKLDKVETTNIFGWNETIIDNNIWEFLDEIISLKLRLDSDLVGIHMTNNTHIGWAFTIAYILGGEAESGVELELKKIYNALQSKHNKTNTDFGYNMSKKLNLEDKNIVVTISNYFTIRKWNLFVRDIDMSKFDVDIKEYSDTNSWGDSAIITIKPKK